MHDPINDGDTGMEPQNETGPEPVRIRPSVMAFAREMERILRENDYKGKPENCPLDVAVDRLFEEARELDRAAYGHPNISTTFDERGEIMKEAVAVANFAFMAWHGATH